MEQLIKQRGMGSETIKKRTKQPGYIYRVYKPYDAEKNYEDYGYFDEHGTYRNLLNVISDEEFRERIDNVLHEAESQQTRIFIEHLFHGAPYKDLAVKYDKDPQHIEAIYNKAKNRVYEILAYLEDKEGKIAAYNSAKNSMKNWELDQTTKCFLLNTCFGFTYQEIVDITGDSIQSVRQYVHKGKKKVKDGLFFIKYGEDAWPVPMTGTEVRDTNQKIKQGILTH
jgi:DNA-directed RNA polymerase specialized sigma24 family protein